MLWVCLSRISPIFSISTVSNRAPHSLDVTASEGKISVSWSAPQSSNQPSHYMVIYGPIISTARKNTTRNLINFTTVLTNILPQTLYGVSVAAVYMDGTSFTLPEDVVLTLAGMYHMHTRTPCSPTYLCVPSNYLCVLIYLLLRTMYLSLCTMYLSLCTSAYLCVPCTYLCVPVPISMYHVPTSVHHVPTSVYQYLSLCTSTYLCVSFSYVYLLLSTDKSISVLGVNSNMTTVRFEPDPGDTCTAEPFESIFVLFQDSGIHYPLIGMCNLRYSEVQMIVNCESM